MQRKWAIVFHSSLANLRYLSFMEKKAPGCFGCIWVFPKIGVFPPKSSILIGFGTIINHPFWGTLIFGNTHIGDEILLSYMGEIINHDIRIFIKQPVYILESKTVFFVAHLDLPPTHPRMLARHHQDDMKHF